MKRWLGMVLLLNSVAAVEVTEMPVEHAGVMFRVVKVKCQSVRVVWKDPKGEPFRSFAKVQQHFEGKGETVKFLMNGGIFEPGEVPSGLHFERDGAGRPVNRRKGEGNFYLQPNGVVSSFSSGSRGGFIGTADRWEAWKSKPRLTRGHPVLSFAVQSGPLLLIDGQRHPAFRDGSPNRLHRNGVGYLEEEETLVFAITANGQVVNFWDFAGLFLKLGCEDALFLDGTISRMAVNPDKPVAAGPFAAMFVVAE